MKVPEKKTIDPAVKEMMEKAKADGMITAFDRAESTKACPIGHVGSCCKNCHMGPCRLVGKTTQGICGATADTVAARNLARSIAGGASAHSDHGRGMVLTLLAAATGEAPDYKIKDETKLAKVAEYLNVKTEGRSKEEIAEDVARKGLENFGSLKDEVDCVKRATQPRQDLWRKLGIAPRGIDREVVETLHRTSVGVDQDMEHIMMHAVRTALGDGWGGSMLSTDVSDILFGTPSPVASRSNFGVLAEDQVNVVVHGHEPTLSDMIVVAANSPDVLEYAKSKGANGINIVGICCTANEVLMRQGVPLLGNFLSQELSIATGAVEAMVVDIQCVMQGIVDASETYHTKIITTSPKAKITGATHIEFHEDKALETAKLILKTAIDNYPNRKTVQIPDYTDRLVAGFSHEYIAYMQGGVYRESFRPFNDAVMSGRIRGAAGVVGCNNPRMTQDDPHLEVVKALIANDVLVVTTGCNAIACAKQGLLTPEVMQYAGAGLREVCEAIGIPPVLHMGSCVDNTRILTLLTQVVNEGGLGEDISDLPVAGFAPEWMSEKALSIGAYVVASGVTTWMGGSSPIEGSEALTKLVGEDWNDVFGATWHFEPSWEKAVADALAHIDAKRKALKLEEYVPGKYAKSDNYLPADYTTDEEFAKYSRTRTK
ncbi:anaerobic carbon-monoxide dehydrogenase catalytic subunit [Chloroflexota bacterium]